MRKMTVIAPTTAVTTLRTMSSTGWLSPSTPPTPCFSIACADPIDDLVVVLEPPEGPATGGDVVDEVRYGVDEVGHLRDERRNDEEPDPRQHEERDPEDDRRRGQRVEAAALERLDGRIQRRGQERRDEDPGQDVPRLQHEDEAEARPAR